MKKFPSLKESLVFVAEIALVGGIGLAFWAALRTPDPITRWDPPRSLVDASTEPAPPLSPAIVAGLPGGAPNAPTPARVLPMIPRVATDKPAPTIASGAPPTDQLMRAAAELRPTDYAKSVGLTYAESEEVARLAEDYGNDVLEWDEMQEQLVKLLGKEKAAQYNEAAINEGIRLSEQLRENLENNSRGEKK